MTAVSDHILWMLIVSVLCAGAAMMLAYMARWQAVLAALGALLLACFSGYVCLESSTLWFWGIATTLTVGISLLLPSQVRDARAGVAYFATGALAGATLGMLLNTVAGVITGSAIGVVLASLAYTRTPAGRTLSGSSQKFLNYLCAKGLPLVVIFSMLGIMSLQLIVNGGQS